MRQLGFLLALPTSLLTFINNPVLVRATDDGHSQVPWPYNLPSHVKYWPEDPPYRRRDLESIQEHIQAGHIPLRMKKMSPHEHEKFFPEYWGFPEQEDQFAIFADGLGDKAGGSLQEDFREGATLPVNTSAVLPFQAPFAFHTQHEITSNQQAVSDMDNGVGRSGRAAVLALLQKRAFQCPTGTSACGAIAPNLCCGTGQTCVAIQDTGLGSVGCCPNGATCAGSITCVVGNTPCASNIGGGCCIPGYVCVSQGCKSALQREIRSSVLILVEQVLLPV